MERHHLVVYPENKKDKKKRSAGREGERGKNEREEGEEDEKTYIINVMFITEEMNKNQITDKNISYINLFSKTLLLEREKEDNNL